MRYIITRISLFALLLNGSYVLSQQRHVILNNISDTAAINLVVNDSLQFDMQPRKWITLKYNEENMNVMISNASKSCSINNINLLVDSLDYRFIQINPEECRVRWVNKATGISNVKARNKALETLIFDLRNKQETSSNSAFDQLISEIEQKIDTSQTKLMEVNEDEYDSLKALALEALRLRFELEEKEKAMKSQLQEYFELMKAINQLDPNVQPVVHLGMEEGDVKANGQMTYNIRATFSYDLISDEGVKAELIHYPPGAYQLDKSAAASATAFSMKKSIENYLSDYFEHGSIVKVRIIGSADASPIYSPIVYLGEYEPIERGTFHLVNDYQLIITQNPLIDSVYLPTYSGSELLTKAASKPKKIQQGRIKNINLARNQGFTANETLAYLRSLGIKEYILSKISALSKTRNEFLHQVKLEESIGGIYRKVVMELLIEDVVRLK